MDTLKNFEQYPEVVKKVCLHLLKMKERYPDLKVDCDGQITYANGNDSTAFDWEVNHRLCEFGWGVEDGSVWAIKCYIDNEGVASTYFYPNGEPSAVETVKAEILTSYEAYKLYRTMVRCADDWGLWDKTLADLKWSSAPTC